MRSLAPSDLEVVLNVLDDDPLDVAVVYLAVALRGDINNHAAAELAFGH